MQKSVKHFLTFIFISLLFASSPAWAKSKAHKHYSNGKSHSQHHQHKSPKLKYSDLDRANKAGEIRGVFERCSGDSSGIFTYIVGRSFSALLTSEGHFTLSYVPPGTYSLAFVKANQVLTIVDGIQVRKHKLTDIGTLEHCVDADDDNFDESVDCDDNNPNIFPGAEEVCNGLDNDCNGVVDDAPDGCIECTDADLDGFFAQEGCDTAVDCNDQDKTVNPNALETCGDGKDNDCDGATDENCPLDCPNGTADCDSDLVTCETDLNNDSSNCGACNTACGPGEVCQHGSCELQCAPNEANCGGTCVDLQTNDNHCGGCNLACGSGQTCNNGLCETQPTCDGIPLTRSCNTGLPGVCASGSQTRTCINGQTSDWSACESDNTPAPEVCDGLDNDCDGVVDDSNPGGGNSCNTGLLGVCAAGSTQCSSTGNLACEPLNQPTAEVCGDGLDNDCDGIVDEGCSGDPCDGVALVRSCATGQVGICSSGTQTRTCDSTSGQVGAWSVCLSTNEPVPETCDGLDNDCDGAVDEGNPGGGTSCDTGLEGVCSNGTTVCSTSGTLVCQQNQGPGAELCDGLDNDCNGVVDDSSSCTTQCSAPSMLCNGVCTNTLVDNNNCGLCGIVCPNNFTCTGGECSP